MVQTKISEGTGGGRRAALIAIAASLLVGFVGVEADAAWATYPGANGRIAYASWELDRPGAVFTIRPDGSGQEHVATGARFVGRPSWSANGQRLTFATGDLDEATGQVYVCEADGSGLTQVAGTGGVHPLLAGPSFSPSGTRLVYSTTKAIRTIRTDGTARRLVLRKRRHGSLANPEYSPNGKRIVFSGAPNGNQKGGIWTIRPSGKRLRRLTNGGESDGFPSWSPDGRSIVYAHPGLGLNWIREMRADGSHQRAVPGTIISSAPTYAPAGDRIAVVRQDLEGSPSDIYTLSLHGGPLQQVTHSDLGDDALYPSWQPIP